MNNFFNISGFILALISLIIGIWDLKVDLKDYRQDNPQKVIIKICKKKK